MKKRMVILIGAVGVFVFAAFRLFMIEKDYADSDMEYRQVEQQAVSEVPDAPVDTFSVDIAMLQSENPDCVGWIRFPNLGISYPIMHGTDNDYYLHHTFKKQKKFAGSIFMDSANADDFSDMNTIIYGHNMKNGSMFALLHRYEKPETLTKEPCFYIYMLDGRHTYEIFSCYTTTDIEYTVFHGAGAAYSEYLDGIKAHALYDTGIQVTGADKIVTLSTCTGNSKSRFIVSGKLIEE